MEKFSLEGLQAFRMGEGREQMYRECVPFRQNREREEPSGVFRCVATWKLELVADPWLGAVEVQWCSGAFTNTAVQPQSCEFAGSGAGSQGQGCAGHFSGYDLVCRGGTWQHPSTRVEHILTPVE